MLLLIITGFLANGYTDPFYLRLTSPKQTSLIIGTSRAANGLHPDVLNHILKQEYPTINLYNFSFTLDDSPFGKIYYEAICEKIKENTKKGVFIVAVDPWSISCKKGECYNDSAFRENKGCLGKIRWVNLYPNFPYLINNYHEPYLSILYKRIKIDIFNMQPDKFLHNDGRFEVLVPLDSTSINKRLQGSINMYKHQYLPIFKPCVVRKFYLIRIISFLKKHGDVYLLKLPVDSRISVIDNALYPQFDFFMGSISKKYSIPYINLADSGDHGYIYRDGVHLEKNSGVILSEKLAQSIMKYKYH